MTTTLTRADRAAMKLPLPSSVKGLVTLIVLMALLPAVGFIVYSSLAKVRLDLDESNTMAMRTAKSILLEQAQSVENTRVLLFTLSQLREVREKSIRECQSLFRNILEQTPFFANIRLLDLKGNVLAASDPQSRVLPDEARIAFFDGLASPGFTVHELRALKEGDAARLNCQIPIRSGRNTTAVLMASVKLEVAQTRLAELAEKHVDNLFVADSQGNILVSYPHKNHIIRTLKQFSPSVWTRISGSAETSGAFADADDKRIVFEKMPGSQSISPEILLVLNIATDTLYSHMLFEIALSVLVLAGVLLLAMIVTFRLCNKNLLAPMRLLLDTAHKLKDGRLETRIGDAPMPTELKVLAESMDSMAESLEHRDRELSKAKDIASAGTQAKTDFLANMSHEIRTPMNAILGMTYLTRQGTLTEQQRIYMDNIHSEADKLLVTINDILDFSKIEAGKLTIENIAFKLPPFIEVLVQNAMEEAEKKGIRFQYSPPVDLPDFVFGDPHHTKQLLNNITGNVIRLTGSGTVTLALECLFPEPDTASDVSLAGTAAEAASGAVPAGATTVGGAEPGLAASDAATTTNAAPDLATHAVPSRGIAVSDSVAFEIALAASSGAEFTASPKAASAPSAEAREEASPADSPGPDETQIPEVKERVQLEFTVSRSGEGMGDKELSALIPDLGSDESDYGGGVSLNLAITQKLVFLLGGELTARPARSGGSDIHISLPVTKATAEDLQDSAPAAPDIAREA
ncbi:HAMP domain-containing protein, partial [Desulfovibrio sp. OttesenSCG-928-G15]|nr:HAMP domain-containing protein [Desulfovibrio sp. OttesenSCG-928-G15]